MQFSTVLLGFTSVYGAGNQDEVAYIVNIAVAPQPIVSYPSNSNWQEVFNPTWVQPTEATGNKSGLLIRSQNCTLPPPSSTPRTSMCHGTGQDASWLTWAELEDDGGKGSIPKVKNYIDEAAAVFGPFDCQPSDNKTCPDSKGTEDPRLTYDPESETYILLYNEWSDGGAYLATASTKNPTMKNWTRHGRTVPTSGGKSGSILYMAGPGPHYLLWGRSLINWDDSKTQDLFFVRKAPFWDTGFVESAMPPLTLSDGNLLFFYNSVGGWDGMGGFQPGWVVLSGNDPTKVLARSVVPPMPYTLPWEHGTTPWKCNTANVANLGGGHAVGVDLFRIYHGGADLVTGTALVSVDIVPKAGNFSCVADVGGLSQCLPTNTTEPTPTSPPIPGAGIATRWPTFPSFDACVKSCIPAAPPPPTPPPPPMKPGILYNNTDILECRTSCEQQTGCKAFTFDDRGAAACKSNEGVCCWLKDGHKIVPQTSQGRESMVLAAVVAV
eukprot:gene2293-13923_t